MYLAVDGKEIPMRGEGTEGFRGKAGDGKSRTRDGRCAAGKPVVISDGAKWIRNSCGALFGDRKVGFLPDAFHALEFASDAVKAVHPEDYNRSHLYS